MMKAQPVVSKPDNFCAFNGRESLPYTISRAEAALCLRNSRLLARKGQCRVQRNFNGNYTLTGSNTLELWTT